MKFVTMKLILLSMIPFLLASCGDSIQLLATIVNESQSSDLQTFTYTIKVEETESECDATNVDVTVDTRISYSSNISPGSTLTHTHSFGDISKGGSKKSTFSIDTGGKLVNIFGGASLVSVDGDPSCDSFLGLGG